MNRSIIQSLWVGNRLSVMEQLSITSFLRNGHEFHLYTYNYVSGVPEGTQIKDANEIIPEGAVFTYHNGSYAGFADWFRWALLHRKGGIWVDTDVVCLKPFIFRSNVVFGLQSEGRAAVGVLGFPSGDELCRFLEKNCANPSRFLPYDSWKDKMKKLKKMILRKKRSEIRWGEAGGPIGFTKALEHFNLLDLAKPVRYFFPIDYLNWRTIFNENVSDHKELYPEAYSIHLWNEMSRKCDDFDRHGGFAENSLFEQLKSRYHC